MEPTLLRGSSANFQLLRLNVVGGRQLKRERPIDRTGSDSSWAASRSSFGRCRGRLAADVGFLADRLGRGKPIWRQLLEHRDGLHLTRLVVPDSDPGTGCTPCAPCEEAGPVGSGAWDRNVRYCWPPPSDPSRWRLGYSRLAQRRRRRLSLVSGLWQGSAPICKLPQLTAVLRRPTPLLRSRRQSEVAASNSLAILGCRSRERPSSRIARLL